MSIKKIMAAAAVSVAAVSAMAVVASAADFTGTIDIEKGDGWKDIAIVSKTDDIPKLIGDADPSTVDTIKFTTDGVDFLVGFDGVDGWTQPEEFTQETTINGSDINWEKSDICVKVAHNGAADPVTISWTVTFKEAAPAESTPEETPSESTSEETPSESAPAAPGNVDTGVEGVAVVLGVAAVAAGALIVAKKRK